MSIKSVIPCVAIDKGVLGSTFYKEGEKINLDPAYLKLDSKGEPTVLPMWLIHAEDAENEELINERKTAMMRTKYLDGLKGRGGLSKRPMPQQEAPKEESTPNELVDSVFG